MKWEVTEEDLASARSYPPSPCPRCSGAEELVAVHGSGQGAWVERFCAWDVTNPHRLEIWAVWDPGSQQWVDDWAWTDYVRAFVRAARTVQPSRALLDEDAALAAMHDGRFWPLGVERWALQVLNPGLSASKAQDYLAFVPGAGMHDTVVADQVPSEAVHAPQLRAEAARLRSALGEVEDHRGTRSVLFSVDTRVMTVWDTHNYSPPFTLAVSSLAAPDAGAGRPREALFTLTARGRVSAEKPRDRAAAKVMRRWRASTRDLVADVVRVGARDALRAVAAEDRPTEESVRLLRIDVRLALLALAALGRRGGQRERALQAVEGTRARVRPSWTGLDPSAVPDPEPTRWRRRASSVGAHERSR